MHQLLNSNFWFLPPDYLLTKADWALGYFFAGLIVLSVIIFFAARVLKNPIVQKLIRKIEHLAIAVGLLGLLWMGMRYENTPIFSYRYWAGLVLVLGLVWLGFIAKFLIFDYFPQRREYEREQLKNKYIPAKR